LRASLCHCERSEAIPLSLRPSSQYHKIAASASPPRNDRDFRHCAHPFVIASAAKQSRCPCERRRDTTRLPRRLRLLAMTGIFVIASIPLSLRASLCHCERSEAIPSSLRAPSQHHKIAASASPPRNDMALLYPAGLRCIKAGTAPAGDNGLTAPDTAFTP
jgi:hypothetical protein